MFVKKRIPKYIIKLNKNNSLNVEIGYKQRTKHKKEKKANFYFFKYNGLIAD